MKQRLALLCCLSVLLPDLLHSAEFTTLDGEHYTGATIKRVDPDGLLVTYPDGVVKIKFKNLPKEVGEKYGYDPTKEATFLAEKRAHDLAAYQEVVRLQNHGADTITPTTSSDANSLKGSTSTRVGVPILLTKAVELIKQSKSWILHFFYTDQTPITANPSPSILVSQALSRSPVEAATLGQMVDDYPDIILPKLQNKVFQLAGTVEKIMVAGLESDRAEITLLTPSRHHITVVMDQSKYSILKTGGSSHHEEWKLIGGKLFRGHSGQPSCIETKQLAPIQVRLDKINPSSVYFEAL